MWEPLKSLGAAPWCWTKGEPPTAFLASPPFLLPVVKRKGAERMWELIEATRYWRGAQDSYTRLYFWPSQLCFLGTVPGRILSGFSKAAKLESVVGLFLLTGNISLVIIQPGSSTNQSSSPAFFLLKTAQREGRISVFIFGSHCVHEVLSPALSGSYSLPPPAIADGGHPSVSPGLWQYLYLHFPVDMRLPLSRGVSW